MTEIKELRHGIDCPKVEHRGTGYLHEPGDDTPYDVDGVQYCGRCHYWMNVRLITVPPTVEVSNSIPVQGLGNNVVAPLRFQVPEPQCPDNQSPRYKDAWKQATELEGITYKHNKVLSLLNWKLRRVDE